MIWLFRYLGIWASIDELDICLFFAFAIQSYKLAVPMEIFFKEIIMPMPMQKIKKNCIDTIVSFFWYIQYSHKVRELKCMRQLF